MEMHLKAIMHLLLHLHNKAVIINLRKYIYYINDLLLSYTLCSPPPQTVIVQQQPQKRDDDCCTACLAGMLCCCLLEECT